jgi:hypothetical protein
VAWNEQDGHATINGGQNNRAKGEYSVVNGGYANEAHKAGLHSCWIQLTHSSKAPGFQPLSS